MGDKRILGPLRLAEAVAASGQSYIGDKGLQLAERDDFLTLLSFVVCGVTV
jgi:hypothetical protein